MNIYLVSVPFETVEDYSKMLRRVVAIAASEKDARSLIAKGRMCCDECTVGIYEKNHPKQCFWVTSPTVTVECLGTAIPGSKPRIVTTEEERSDNED